MSTVQPAQDHDTRALSPHGALSLVRDTGTDDCHVMRVAVKEVQDFVGEQEEDALSSRDPWRMEMGLGWGPGRSQANDSSLVETPNNLAWRKRLNKGVAEGEEGREGGTSRASVGLRPSVEGDPQKSLPAFRFPEHTISAEPQNTPKRQAGEGWSHFSSLEN